MKTKRITLFLLAFTLLMSALTAAFLTPAQTVSAQGLKARTPDPDKLAKLSEYFQKEKDWLNQQATHLQTAYEGAAKVQELIDAARANGKDVSALEAALAAYNSGLAQAQAEHDNAELAIHPAAIGDEIHGTQKYHGKCKGNDKSDVIIQVELLIFGLDYKTRTE